MIEDWDDYRFFLSIAEHGTLKSTAAALKVNLSTVLRRINTLEKKMGARLFDRSHDGFTLTPAGNIMKEHAEAMQYSVIELMRKVKDTDHQSDGVIKLATTDSLFQNWLGPLIKEFREHHPDIYFEFLVSPRNINLAKHEADIAISVGNIRPDYMIGRKLMDVHYRFYGLTALYGDKAPVTNKEQLETLPIMHMNADFSHQPFYKWHKTHVPNSISFDSADHFTVMHQMIRLGLGVGLLPHYLGDRDTELAILFTLPEEANKELWILTHPDLRNVSRIRKFMEFVRKYCYK
jgi:DNA-binding transcriptional LysR family regulator